MVELNKIKGIGDKTLALFERLGIHDSSDLLKYYPKDYEAFEPIKKIADLKANEIASVNGVVLSKPTIIRKGHFQMFKVRIDDGSARIDVFWFNSPFLYSKIKMGDSLVLRGRVACKGFTLMLSQPKIYKEENYNELQGKIFPIYALTKGLSNLTIRKAQKIVTDNLEIEPIKDYLPNEIRKNRELAEINFSLSHIHFPNDFEDMLFARKRLAYDELFMFSLAINYFKTSASIEKNDTLQNCSDIYVKKVIENLKYKLTASQNKTLCDIFNDFKNKVLMNRLIQGDVGSGKTIIAFLAMLYVASGNKQSCLMAPTEVLAVQHYNNLVKLIKENELPIKAVLLLGQTKKAERTKIENELKSGEALIAIGTHALFSRGTEFNNLALVITDEQHRFGVNQRKNLEKKSEKVNVLVMSATPIPRTLSMLLYSDMQVSQITEKPTNRKEIKNALVDETYRDKAYSFIQKQINEGHQAYIICAQVEPTADSENEGSFSSCENVNDYAKKLKKVFGKNVNIQVLHGKMKAKDKEKIMQDFSDEKIDILIATTVVEVGVDNPNATVIMIEDAQMFGLATLHQLRGRVGRGTSQSYAIFVNTKKTDKSEERLQILNHSNDGFFIAEEDLRLRGPGDIFGVRQSGDMDFEIADVYTDREIFKNATEDAKSILHNDPTLSKKENKYVKDTLDAYLEKRYTI